MALLIEGVGADRSEHLARAHQALAAHTRRRDLILGRRPSGRPCLAPPHPELGVSMSWRTGVLLVGFSPHRAVGVDLEPDDAAAVPDPVLLARDHFAAGEAMAVAGLPATEARALFLRLWVAKEAALKLTGRGIADGLTEPDLSDLLDTIGQDGIALGADIGRADLLRARRPVELVVGRVALRDGRAVYCALAVDAADGSPEIGLP